VKRPEPREAAFTIAGIAGIAAVFIPDARGRALIRVVVIGEFWLTLWLSAWALAIPITASTVRQALFGPLTKWEVRAAYALSFAALVATSIIAVECIAMFQHMSGSGIENSVILPSLLISTIGAIIILAATMRSRVPPSIHAHVAMLVAWILNSGLLAALFPRDYFSLGLACYLLSFAIVGFTYEAVLRVRGALRSDRRAED